MRGVLALVWLLALTKPALADNEPWTNGVATADQERANALFAEANRFYAQQAYAPAVAIWDHPVIRFNLAVTLFKVERYVEAGEALDAALKFGNQPFSAEQLAQIGEYQTKLRDHIGELTARCTGDATHVSLDGKEWFTCPGTQTRRVIAGEHAIVAETAAQHISVAAGTKVSTVIRQGSLERVERRWPTWIPWTVGLSGCAAIVGAGVVSFYARTKYDEYAQNGIVISSDKYTIQEATDRANHYYRMAKYAT